MAERDVAAGGLERKLATILSADVAAYSRLMAEDEERTLQIFRAHKEVFEKLVELHRGRVFNTAGDAILAEFSSAVEAVRYSGTRAATFIVPTRVRSRER
jgi:adenylate cyclase